MDALHHAAFLASDGISTLTVFEVSLAEWSTDGQRSFITVILQLTVNGQGLGFLVLTHCLFPICFFFIPMR